jgi:hypothetical protein
VCLERPWVLGFPGVPWDRDQLRDLGIHSGQLAAGPAGSRRRELVPERHERRGPAAGPGHRSPPACRPPRPPGRPRHPSWSPVAISTPHAGCGSRATVTSVQSASASRQSVGRCGPTRGCPDTCMSYRTSRPLTLPAIRRPPRGTRTVRAAHRARLPPTGVLVGRKLQRVPGAVGTTRPGRSSSEPFPDPGNSSVRSHSPMPAIAHCSTFLGGRRIARQNWW